MSKELTPLEALHSFDHWIQVEFADQFKIIEKALKEKDQEQKKLNELEKLLEHERELNNILITKKLKALEIIVKKRVEIAWFINCLEESKILPNYNAFEHYNRGIVKPLTQEEFDLLKEMLKSYVK